METPKTFIIPALIFMASVFVSILVGNLFDIWIMDADKEWDKTLKFTEENAIEFPYAIETKQGNLNATGEVKAASPLLTNEYLPAQYLAIREVQEEYRMHTETYSCNCRSVNNQTQCSTCTRTYWSWDRVGSATTTVERVSLLGQEMLSTFIPWRSLFYEPENTIDGKKYLDTGYNKRSYFEVLKPGVTGSFGFTSDDNGFRYNADLSGPRSDSLVVMKIVVLIFIIGAGITGAYHFAMDI